MKTNLSTVEQHQYFGNEVIPALQQGNIKRLLVDQIVKLRPDAEIQGARKKILDYLRLNSNLQ